MKGALFPQFQDWRDSINTDVGKLLTGVSILPTPQYAFCQCSESTIHFMLLMCGAAYRK